MAVKTLNFEAMKKEIKLVLAPLKRVRTPSLKARHIIKQLERSLRNIDACCPQQMAETIETHARSR